MRVIGIDPGKTGGISYLDFDRDAERRSITEAFAIKMPDSEAGVSEYLQKLSAPGGRVFAFIERVQAMPSTRQERDGEAVRNLTIQIAGRYDERIGELLRKAGIGVSTKIIQGSVGTFTFGQGYGFLRGCLRTAGIEFASVRPQDWQTLVGCRTRGDKNVSKRRAIELFPSVEKKITHATADAFLIAEYGRRLGSQNWMQEEA